MLTVADFVQRYMSSSDEPRHLTNDSTPRYFFDNRIQVRGLVVSSTRKRKRNKTSVLAATQLTQHAGCDRCRCTSRRRRRLCHLTPLLYESCCSVSHSNCSSFSGCPQLVRLGSVPVWITNCSPRPPCPPSRPPRRPPRPPPPASLATATSKVTSPFAFDLLATCRVAWRVEAVDVWVRHVWLGSAFPSS